MRGQDSPEHKHGDCAHRCTAWVTHTGKDGRHLHTLGQDVTALTDLEAAHVVDLGAESQRGQNMDHRENDPKPHVIFPKHLKTKTQ